MLQGFICLVIDCGMGEKSFLIDIYFVEKCCVMI